MITVSNLKKAANECDELTKAVNKAQSLIDKGKIVADTSSTVVFPFPDTEATKALIKATFHGPTFTKPQDQKVTIASSQAEKEASPVGLRFNKGKVRWDLVDPTAVEGIAKVLDFGTIKYTAENWRKGLSWKATLRSLESHLQALKRGEDIDPESGLPHIDHLGCNWMFFSNYQKMGVGEDDRVKSSAVDKIAAGLAKEYKERELNKSIIKKADELLAERQREWDRQTTPQEDWVNKVSLC